MKNSKRITAIVFLAAILLSGCFGFFEKKSKSAETTERPAASESSSTAQNGKANVPEPPSFQDGDYYLQALAARSLDICQKIKNAKLKQRCEEKINKAAQE